MHRLFLVLILLGISGALTAEPARETARALIDAGDLSGARATLRRQVDAEPQNAEPHFWLGVIAGRLHETDEAIRQLEQATALDPKNSDYQLELGGAYGNAAQKAGLFGKLGWAKKCQSALEKAVELNPDSVGARSGLVNFYRQAPSFAGGSVEKAYAQVEEIRKRDPLAGTVLLGQLYVDDRKPAQAFAVFTQALQQAPDDYGVLYGIGRASAQTGQQLDLGEKSLRRCLELTPKPGQPGPAPVQWRLGNIAEKRGDKAAARSAYEAALRADPHFEPAAKSLAKLNG